MNRSQAKAIIKDCVDRGWMEHNGTYYPPNSNEAKRLQAETAHSTKKKQNRAKGLKSLKTGWTDDSRNIKNKATHTDQFTRLIEIELGLIVWPEFYFTIDRKWRFDYAIPAKWNKDSVNPLNSDLVEYKIAVEVEGGAWTRGRHTRPLGFINDMEKYNRATAEGWLLIRVTPSQLLTSDTIDLIKKAIVNKH